MKKSYTNRGFGHIEVELRHGEQLSIQKSSLATENAIWMGAAEENVKAFIPSEERAPYFDWVDIDVRELIKMKHSRVDGIVTNTRVEITQEKMKELLPIFKHFAETGELPDV